MKSNFFIILTLLLTLLLTLSQLRRAEAEGLLRLFTTVQERAILDAERLKPKKKQTIILKKTVKIIHPKQASKKIQKIKPPNYITFNGVIRGNGNNRQPIVWINNSTDLAQQGFRVELDNITEELSVTIILNNQQRILLKPGQTLNTLNGKIK